MHLACRLGRHLWDRLNPECPRCHQFREGWNVTRRCRRGRHEWKQVLDGHEGPVLFCDAPRYTCGRCRIPLDAMMHSPLCQVGRHDWRESHEVEGSVVHRCDRCDLERGWEGIGSKWEYFRCRDGVHSKHPFCVPAPGGRAYFLICWWCGDGEDRMRSTVQHWQSLSAEERTEDVAHVLRAADRGTGAAADE